MSTISSHLKKSASGLKPIEALVELLPREHVDALRNIHLAGQANRWQEQIGHLEGLRRTVSSCRSDPAYDARTKDHFAQSLHLIDAMRANAKDCLACTPVAALTVGATDPASMPESMAQVLTEFKSRASSLDPKMAYEAAMYITRVQLCAKQGAFALIERYSDRFVEQAREAHRNSAQALLGPVAVKANEIGQIAKALAQGQELTMPQSHQAKAPSPPQHMPAPGDFLLNTLRGHVPAEDNAQRHRFRPH